MIDRYNPSNSKSKPSPVIVIIKRVLEILLIVLAIFSITEVITGGFKINLSFIKLSFTDLHKISIYLLFIFFIRLYISSVEKNDEFAVKVRKITSSQYFPLCLFITISTIFIVIKIHYHLTFMNWARDFSVYEYAFFNTLTGNFMYSPFLNKCYFAEHFSPILLTALPFYALIPSIYTLIVWQAILLAGAVIPAFLLSNTIWKDSISSTLFSVGLMTMAVFGYVLECDVHQEAVYPLLFLTLVYALEKENKTLFTIGFLIMLTVKEDAPIYACFFAISAIFYRRWWRVGILTLLISVIYWFSVIYLLMPALGARGYGPPQILARWGQYGNSTGEISLWFLTHPIQVMKMMFRSEVLKFFPLFLFTSILSPWVLLAIPYLIIHSTSNIEIQYNLTAYFGAPAATLFAISSIYGIKNLSIWLSKIKIDAKKLILLLAFSRTIINICQLHLIKIDKDTLVAENILSRIPENASFSAAEHIFPHIRPHKEIYILPEIDNAEYIFIDTGLFSGVFTKTDAMITLNKQVLKGKYKVIDKGSNRFYLLKRTDEIKKTSDNKQLKFSIF